MAVWRTGQGILSPRAIAALAALVLGSAAFTPAPRAATAPPAPERVQISLAEERGRLIYAYDQAAWYSTDEMRRVVPAATLPKTGGWIVEPQGDLLRVIYYGADSGPPTAFFSADMRGRKIVHKHLFEGADDRALSARALRMVEARRAAVQARGRTQ